LNSGFRQDFEDANVGQASNGAAAQSETDSSGTKLIETAHPIQVYSCQRP
jgi:hypothetical protein